MEYLIFDKKYLKSKNSGLTQLAYYFEFVVYPSGEASYAQRLVERTLVLKIRAKALTTNYKSDFFVTLA
jgi:hypothetical protein